MTAANTLSGSAEVAYTPTVAALGAAGLDPVGAVALVEETLNGLTGRVSNTRGMLDLADLLTKHARWVECRVARLVATACQAAADDETERDWTISHEHALRNGLTPAEGERLERVGRAGLADRLIGDAQDLGQLSVQTCDVIV
ncbi:MAG: hypothetical protein LBU05_07005, partial [Bifidobacteriaceae bacterium]|nr:hypothetical protein [Bifidobacteriaceae bacterium]